MVRALPCSSPTAAAAGPHKQGQRKPKLKIPSKGLSRGS